MAPTDQTAPAATDQDLLSVARRGDYAAFEEIVRRYQDRVYRLGLGMTSQPAEAEEVVQDTFLSIFRGLASFRGDASLSSWIFRVAANASLMVLRRQRRKPHLSLEDTRPDYADDGGGRVRMPGAWVGEPDEMILSGELKGLIEAAITGLPEKYRLVLLLKDVEGLSNDEVAQTLGLTVPTVKARLHRSRLIVREQLDDYFNKR
ncbi:MAG: sigma-70 family RNA polymerase sigma factor [Deltaproteobacteria bacterium]|nr:sigma-70 family RNA polymerase sigma factor [Deltaproteobacteria bacterium]